MSDPSLELQAAIIARLKGDSGVTALVAQRVYWEVPANPTFPYISLADNQVLPDDVPNCITGFEIFWQIDAWARDPYFPDCAQISKAVQTALHNLPLTLTGYTNVICEMNTVNYLRDPDGITRHAAMNYRFLIQAL